MKADAVLVGQASRLPEGWVVAGPFLGATTTIRYQRRPNLSETDTHELKTQNSKLFLGMGIEN